MLAGCRLQVPPSLLADDGPLTALAGEYLRTLLDYDRRAATRLILDAVGSGVPVEDIYLHVFQRCQREVGRLWQARQIAVVQEHFVTAVTQSLMARLSPITVPDRGNGRRAVAASVGGERHEVGLRVVADFFEMAGYETLLSRGRLPLAEPRRGRGTTPPRSPADLGDDGRPPAGCRGAHRRRPRPGRVPGCDDPRRRPPVQCRPGPLATVGRRRLRRRREGRTRRGREAAGRPAGPRGSRHASPGSSAREDSRDRRRSGGERQKPINEKTAHGPRFLFFSTSPMRQRVNEPKNALAGASGS